MSKTTDALRAMGVINTYDLLKRFSMPYKDDLVVMFTGADGSRGGCCAHTSVWSPNYKTDPKAAWYNLGNKTFNGGRVESFSPGIRWAAEKMKIHPFDMVPNPVDPHTSVIARAVRERALKALAEFQANQRTDVIGLAGLARAFEEHASPKTRKRARITKPT